MSTPAQIEANQEHSQFSSGPRPPKAKPLPPRTPLNWASTPNKPSCSPPKTSRNSTP